MSELDINWEKLTIEERIKELKGGRVSPKSLEVLSSIPRTWDLLEDELRQIIMDYQDLSSVAIENLVIDNTSYSTEFEFMRKVISHSSTTNKVLEHLASLDTEDEDSTFYNDEDVESICEEAAEAIAKRDK